MQFALDLHWHITSSISSQTI